MHLLFNNQLFTSPVTVIKCYKFSEVNACLAKIEKAVTKGFYLAGFLSYEAGYAFETIFHHSKTYDFPLLCFGVYNRPVIFKSPPSPTSFLSISPKNSLTRQKYLSAIKKIKKHLSAGDTYQVNYTFKLKFDFHGSPWALFEQLIKRQPTTYSAYIEDDNFTILSLSPELFFRKQGTRLIVKPMKGTIGRGRGNRQRLQNDKKNRAENLMIVDLLRNDLGRIAKPGTVKTVKLFEVEEHSTLYQMTSTIEAKVDNNITLIELFSNLFPSGSVTGAPKIRTMQIIRELEKEPRNIYTGAIGYISPERELVFNVAIRTLFLTSTDHDCSFYQGEFGLGSGITYDSNPKEEWDECLLKSNFLTT